MTGSRPTVVVVGGVAGGMSTAARLRRNLEHAHIIVVERSAHVSYANCGLPYHLGGIIEDRDELLLHTPASLRDRFNLDVRVRTEASGIDLASRTVSLRDLETGATSSVVYDSLVLAPGATPVTLPIPGIERAHALRTVEDMDAIARGLDEHPRTACVLGGGFVGLELAENLVRRGLDVTVVELGAHVLAPLDEEMVQPVEEHLRAQGVRLRTGTGAARVHDDAVELEDGTMIPADLVVAAAGVRPDSQLARDAGLQLDARGGILVDEQQRTSDPHVFAVGDAAVKRDAVSGEPTLVPLAQTANRHGRLVADVIAGRSPRSRPVLGTAVVGLFGLTVATTGWNERRLRDAGREHLAIHTHPPDHASYYPGASGMSLKLLVDPRTHAILGAQAVGAHGVDKRIDVIATAMRAGLTAPELADLELAYAPQFGSAKDPVNMLGYVAENVLTGTVRSIQWHELDAAVDAEATILDVRSAAEHAAGAIPGSVNVPLEQLRAQHEALPGTRPLIVHCEVGVRANTAARLLTQLGHDDVLVLDGSYRTWRAGTESRSARDGEPLTAPITGGTR